jgi:hypothetical protein
MAIGAQTPRVWKKSSSCTGTANCVEVASLGQEGMEMRDGKDPQSPVLHFDVVAWSEFVTAVRAGEFR